MIPAWLQRQLEQQGRWDTDGIARRLRPGRCNGCGEAVVRGLDADVAGLPVTCDPWPVDALGEALAVITGRGSYALQFVAGRWQISHRDHWHLRAQKPATVLAGHACGQPLPAGPPISPPTTRPWTGDEIPF